MLGNYSMFLCINLLCCRSIYHGQSLTVLKAVLLTGSVTSTVTLPVTLLTVTGMVGTVLTGPNQALSMVTGTAGRHHGDHHTTPPPIVMVAV